MLREIEHAPGAQDLALDSPDAAHVLALFMGRAIVDEVLPPSALAAALPSLRNASLGVSVVKATGIYFAMMCLHCVMLMQVHASLQGTAARACMPVAVLLRSLSRHSSCRYLSS